MDTILQQTNGMEFERDTLQVRLSRANAASQRTHWLIRLTKGLIKSERQANAVLIVFIILSLGISALLFYNGFSGVAQPDPSKIIDVATPN